jgi:hypothetical protein
MEKTLQIVWFFQQSFKPGSNKKQLKFATLGYQYFLIGAMKVELI